MLPAVIFFLTSPLLSFVMVSLTPNISIFDIHLLVQLIASELTPQDIERCLLVSKNWSALFFPFLRIPGKWDMAPLTLADQARPLKQCPNLWTLQIPLDDSSFQPLIESEKMTNLLELTCFGAEGYKKSTEHQHNSRCPDLQPLHYNLPGKIEKLLKVASRLRSLTIFCECLWGPHQPNFRDSMLRTLADHKALTTLTLNFQHVADWPGIYAALHSLPETIETFELSGACSNYWSVENPEPPLPVWRIEPYHRLTRLKWSHGRDRSKISRALVPFLRLCPRFQELELQISHSLWRSEKILADALLAYCPDLNSFDFSNWKTLEQMRVIQGCAFRKLRVFDWILREDVNQELSSEGAPGGLEASS